MYICFYFSRKKLNNPHREHQHRYSRFCWQDHLYLEAVRLPAAELLVEGLHASDAPRSREVPNAAINGQQPSIAAPSPRELPWWNSECLPPLTGAGEKNDEGANF